MMKKYLISIMLIVFVTLGFISINSYAVIDKPRNAKITNKTDKDLCDLDLDIEDTQKKDIKIIDLTNDNEDSVSSYGSVKQIIAFFRSISNFIEE